jgi:hypothetical protein
MPYKGLEDLLDFLKRKMSEVPPSPSVIEEAKTIMGIYPREALPGWLDGLVNGDTDHLAEVIDETLIHMRAEEMPE